MGYTRGWRCVVPWEERSVSEQRSELVALIGSGVSVSEAARRLGVSRKTASKWWGRYQLEGMVGLVDRSRARRSVHPAVTAPEMVELVCGVRDEHTTWGGRKIRRVLLNQGHTGVPATSTITDILRREGRIQPPVRSQREYIRFRAPVPNELWQMDFKGDFSLTGGGRCYPLTVIDDHSRFLVGLTACANQQRDTVKTALTTVFRTVGLPVTIICDHGPPWGHDTTQPYTRLGAWLLSLGVDIIHGRPFHPQTRGKGERVHRTMGEDLLDTRHWDTLGTVQDALDDWLGIYNHYRPHQALDLDTPADHYQPSPRVFPEVIALPDYPRPRDVRIVQANGNISWAGSLLKAGKAFGGQPVQVTIHPDETITITYYQTIIKTHPGPVTHDPAHL